MRRLWIAVGTAVALMVAGCGSEDAGGAGAPVTSIPQGGPTAPSTSGDVARTTIPLVSVDPAAVATGGQGTTTTEDRPSPPTSAAVPATTLPPDRVPGVQVIGRGRPQWFSPNGSAVIVADTDDSVTGATCAVGEPSVLYRQPLGRAERTLAILGPRQPAGQRARPAKGTVGILDSCGGQLTAVWTGDEAANGLIAGLTEHPFAQPIDPAGVFTVTPDGTGFIGSTLATDAAAAGVVRIDAVSGMVDPLFLGEYLQINQRSDGSYLGVTWAGEVRSLAADGTLIDVRVGGPIAVSPGGETAVVFTDQGLEIDRRGQEPVRVSVAGAADTDQGPWTAAVLPDDQGVVFTRRSGVDQPIFRATLDGDLVQLLPADQWGDLVVSGNGARLATSRPVEDPTQLFAEETVVITL